MQRGSSPCYVSVFSSLKFTKSFYFSRHNDQPFSKFAFLAGKYDKWDMANLTLTNTRDFAMFMALDSAKIGVNRTVALEKFKQDLKGKSVMEYCATVKNP